jgi:hypothetical protein
MAVVAGKPKREKVEYDREGEQQAGKSMLQIPFNAAGGMNESL